MFSDSQLQLLRSSKGKHAQFISDSCRFYRDWHVQSDGVYGNLKMYSLVNGNQGYQGKGIFQCTCGVFINGILFLFNFVRRDISS